MKERKANIRIIKLRSVGSLHILTFPKDASMNNMNIISSDSMSSSHILKHVTNSPTKTSVTVFLVHIFCCSSGFTSDKQTISFHMIGLLFFNFLHRKSFTSHFLDPVHSFEEIPKFGFRLYIVVCEEPHTVDYRVRVFFWREFPASHQILSYVHSETWVAFHHLLSWPKSMLWKKECLF